MAFDVVVYPDGFTCTDGVWVTVAGRAYDAADLDTAARVEAVAHLMSVHPHDDVTLAIDAGPMPGQRFPVTVLLTQAEIDARAAEFPDVDPEEPSQTAASALNVACRAYGAG